MFTLRLLVLIKLLVLEYLLWLPLLILLVLGCHLSTIFPTYIPLRACRSLSITSFLRPLLFCCWGGKPLPSHKSEPPWWKLKRQSSNDLCDRINPNEINKGLQVISDLQEWATGEGRNNKTWSKQNRWAKTTSPRNGRARLGKKKVWLR